MEAHSALNPDIQSQQEIRLPEIPTPNGMLEELASPKFEQAKAAYSFHRDKAREAEEAMNYWKWVLDSPRAHQQGLLHSQQESNDVQLEDDDVLKLFENGMRLTKPDVYAKLPQVPRTTLSGRIDKMEDDGRLERVGQRPKQGRPIIYALPR